jgi:hypothetical protein
MYRPGVAFPDTLQGPCADVGLLDFPPLTPCPTSRRTRTPVGRKGPRARARFQRRPYIFGEPSESYAQQRDQGGASIERCRSRQPAQRSGGRPRRPTGGGNHGIQRVALKLPCRPRRKHPLSCPAHRTLRGRNAGIRPARARTGPPPGRSRPAAPAETTHGFPRAERPHQGRNRPRSARQGGSSHRNQYLPNTPETSP